MRFSKFLVRGRRETIHSYQSAGVLVAHCVPPVVPPFSPPTTNPKGLGVLSGAPSNLGNRVRWEQAIYFPPPREWHPAHPAPFIGEP